MEEGEAGVRPDNLCIILDLLILFSFSVVEEQFSKLVSEKICRFRKEEDGNKQNLESCQQMLLHCYSGSVGSFLEDLEYEIYMVIEYLLTWGRGKA